MMMKIRTMKMMEIKERVIIIVKMKTQRIEIGKSIDSIRKSQLQRIMRCFSKTKYLYK
jgi:hypothetical protein